jgi:hypothetical protein
MTDPDPEPRPPASLPKYIAEGLPKQDDDALRDVVAYAEELLEYREQEIATDQLPDDAEPAEEADDGKGTLVKEKVTCGDDSCACMSGGDKHGPYLYRYYHENGSLTSEYVGRP